MDRLLASAVIAAFHDESAAAVRARFAPFDERDWLRTREWLHTSGLALYFLARAESLGLEEQVPAQILNCLNTNLAENRVRNQALFDEFVKINMDLQRARLSYLNLKGFTLSPRSCPDPVYRYQHDLDFLVARRDADRFRRTIERHGYARTAVFGDTWEFRAGPAEVSTLRDLYRIRSQRSLELHILPDQDHAGPEHCGDKISRMQLQVWNGFEFPALSECDKLLAQALHLFKHFQTEWTRTAWMLEYATAIRSHNNDPQFWQRIVSAIDTEPASSTGIGVASLITSRAFAVALPANFRSRTIDAIPEHVRLWVDRYQDEVVFIEHPGSKLYLLLQDVLWQNHPDWQLQRRNKLFPSSLPPKLNASSHASDARQWWTTKWIQFCFVCKRVRFHVMEGLRYKIEASRWKRFVAGLQA